MADPIVVQLQTDCLDASVPISTLLRKAKLVASKLDLGPTEEWVESELNGYKCPLKDLPEYRKGVGQPKFFNPYHGWLDIVLTDSTTREMVSTAFLPQAIAEIEHLARGDGSFVIFGFIDPINDFLHHDIGIEYNCGLHVSKTVLVGALEGVKNAVLDWAMQLEAKGIRGEGVSFSSQEKEKAQAVTTNIYGSNIGVLGSVGSNAKVSHQTIETVSMSPEALVELASKIREAAIALPSETATAIAGPLKDLEEGAKTKNTSKIQAAMNAMIPVLQGAGGNIVAAGILTALGVS
jgi:hypothetical protein